MARASFGDYVFPLDHPQVARLKGKDAHAHAAAMRADPRAQELLIEPWSQLITELFTGITTDGTPVQGLFDTAPNDAPAAEMVSAARRLLDLVDDEDRKSRIQSPVIMIEFDEHAGVFLSNEEPERFHIHTIVRTPNGNDYAMDLVRMHYDRAHPGRRPGC